MILYSCHDDSQINGYDMVPNLEFLSLVDAGPKPVRKKQHAGFSAVSLLLMDRFLSFSGGGGSGLACAYLHFAVAWRSASLLFCYERGRQIAQIVLYLSISIHSPMLYYIYPPSCFYFHSVSVPSHHASSSPHPQICRCSDGIVLQVHGRSDGRYVLLIW